MQGQSNRFGELVGVPANSPTTGGLASRVVSVVRFVLLIWACGVPASLGQETVEFDRDVLPVLQEHCIACHGPDEANSMLRLDSMVHGLKGGNSGEKAIDPGNSGGSYLIELITHDDPDRRMPPESDPLPRASIEVLRRWIDDADQWKSAQQELANETPDHWSFQPLARPSVPDVGQPQAIDAFVVHRLWQSNLTLSQRADRRKLIRRLYLVMQGLPPTPEQVTAFIEDDRSDAWLRLVDQVLESPRYGERWGQHWMDLARFGETTGFETNRERPNAWPYRDWVIDAFNTDKPYDQFIIEQLAGDAVGAPVGTGFLVAGPNDIVKGRNPELAKTQRQDELADMINTASTAFLGLTVGCARCHNHKFDPVTQTDYYAMVAVFSGVNHGTRTLPLPPNTQSRIAELSAQIDVLSRRLRKFVPSENPQLREAVTATRNVESFEPTESRFVRFTIDATNRSQPCIDELEVFSGGRNVALASSGAKPVSSGDFVHPLHRLSHINDGQFGNAKSWISSVVKGGWVQIEFAKNEIIDQIVWQRDREGRYSDRLAVEYRIESSVDGESWTLLAGSTDRNPYKGSSEPQFDFSSFPEDEAAAGQRWLSELEAKQNLRTQLQQSSNVYVGTFAQPGPTHRLYRGEQGSPREQVPPAGIASLSGPKLAEESPEQQRRLVLAKWIANATNPLTARVIVNRLWQFHFGTGIVDTPSDFGRNGSRPTHPQLLDWLATELIRSGWSLKHLQRTILLSATWQQDSRPRPEALAIDADSRQLWRFPPRRLEAEAVRDSILAVSGKLDLTMGGPGFSAFEVQMENVRHYFPKKSYGPGDWRRMVYMTKVRQERDSVFGVFDCPDNSQVTPQRGRSTTPLQALNLLNSAFVNQQAEMLVARLESERTEPAAKITRAYELCFGRPPTSAETSAASDFIVRTNWNQFARAMLNANEFVFIP